MDDYLQRIFEPDRERMRRVYEEVLPGDQGWQVEYRIKRPDGELRWVREVGKVYKGVVTGLKEFGCFVEILPVDLEEKQRVLESDDVLASLEFVERVLHK